MTLDVYGHLGILIFWGRKRGDVGLAPCEPHCCRWAGPADGRRRVSPVPGLAGNLSLLPKTAGEKFPQAVSSGQERLLKAEPFLTGAGKGFVLCPHGRRTRGDKPARALGMESKDLS